MKAKSWLIGFLLQILPVKQISKIIQDGEEINVDHVCYKNPLKGHGNRFFISDILLSPIFHNIENLEYLKFEKSCITNNLDCYSKYFKNCRDALKHVNLSVSVAPSYCQNKSFLK